MASNSRAVIIVGGGFAGLTIALSLSNVSLRPPIILIEPRPRFVFLPLLYELLSNELKTWEVAPTYQSLLSNRGIVLIQDSVKSIDTREKSVNTVLGLKLEYFQLVLATGVQTNDFGVQGVSKYSLSFKRLEDIEILRKKIQALKLTRDQPKNIVLVGAGATGVELACKLSDLLDSETELHLIERGNRILPQGKSFNQVQAERSLFVRNVKVHLNTSVVAISSDQIELQTLLREETIHSFLSHKGVVWTAGTKPVIPLGLPQNLLKNGRLVVDKYLKVIGLRNVFALGDVAYHEFNPYSATAQVAMQQGEVVARNLMAIFCGKCLEPFELRDFGEMLSLGIGEATITGLGFTLAGSLAFRIRRLAYLGRMPGLTGLRSAGAWLLGD